MTTPLQQAATELMDAMAQTDFTCRLGNQLDALEKALEAEQAQAVEPVATVQCINGVTIGYLDAMQPVGTKLYLHPAPTPAGKRVPEAAFGNIERAELIADLRLNHEYCPKEVILEAADMLEADVSLINEGNKAQQVAVPMTEAQIFACDPVPHVMFDQQRIDFARAIEAFHGITGAKP